MNTFVTAVYRALYRRHCTKGVARDVRVAVLPPHQDKPWRVDVRADLVGIHSQAYGYIPALAGVDAKLHLMPHRGRVTLQMQTSAPILPLYAQAWALEQAFGRLAGHFGQIMPC